MSASRHQTQSPKGKLSRIEEHDYSEDEQDEDDVFLQDLERENKMLEGVLKDLQGVIKKERKEYSFEGSPKDRHHFTSVRPSTHSSPLTTKFDKNNSKIPRMRGSVDAGRANRGNQKLKRSLERSSGSLDRNNPVKKSYENQTQSSKNKKFLATRKSMDAPIVIDDDEEESMEMKPPVPFTSLRHRPEINIE